MKSIIQQNYKELIGLFLKNIKEIFDTKENLGEIVLKVHKLTDQLGLDLIQEYIEDLDQSIFELPERKRHWEPIRITKNKSLITEMGELKYNKRYYKNKQNGDYKHLVDEVLGLTPKQRLSTEYEAKLVDFASDISYEKSSIKAGRIKVSRQTVKNIVHKYKEDELKHIELIDKKRECEVLYVEADEDHISLQNGKKTITKLVYVHEGKEGQKRKTLKNTKYFSGVKCSSDKLYEEVYNYIKNTYDETKIKRIYVMGDGASWIKKGLEKLPESKFVLDKFHIKKYIMKATVGYEKERQDLMDSVSKADKEWFIKIIENLIDKESNESKKKDIFDTYRYIMNNWEGIEIYKKEEQVIGCSAEGHISHILSDRMSSRPIGWSRNGADNIAKLRAFKANGGKVIEISRYNKRNQKVEGISRKKLTKVNNKKIKKRTDERLDNLAAISIGRKTGLYTALKAIR